MYRALATPIAIPKNYRLTTRRFVWQIYKNLRQQILLPLSDRKDYALYLLTVAVLIEYEDKSIEYEDKSKYFHSNVNQLHGPFFIATPTYWSISLIQHTVNLLPKNLFVVDSLRKDFHSVHSY